MKILCKFKYLVLLNEHIMKLMKIEFICWMILMKARDGYLLVHVLYLLFSDYMTPIHLKLFQ